MNAEILLSVITLVLGGGNLLQFINYKATRSKANEEARSVKIDNDQKALDVLQDSQLANDKRINDMHEKLMTMQEKLLNIMEEMALLKIELKKSKALECHDFSCQIRKGLTQKN